MDIWERFSSDVKIAKIQKWLSAPDPAVNFQEALKLREANTGLWLLNSDIFKRWKDKDSFLWLHGIPGCGKTILSSTLLESLLKQTSDSPATAVAYFYFDFSDKQKQDTTSMIRSFISQLLKLSMKVSGSLHGLYFTSRNGQRPPSLFALLEVLKQLIKEFQRTYIIIDALDECNTRRELMSTIEDMSTWQLQGLHVLFTSRREPDIEEALGCILDGKNILGIQTEAVDHDIQLYVRQRLSIEAGLRWKLDVDDAVKHQIEISLKKGAHGIFRWAVCQLDTLGQCRDREQVLEALAGLPSNLDETYEIILCAIQESKKIYANRILQWLVFAYRPLTLAEIAQVAATDPDRYPAFSRDEVLEDPLKFLSICSSLVTVTFPEDMHRYTGNDGEPNVHTGPVVLLAHYSVKEYLVSKRILESGAKLYSLEPALCHRFITKCCIQYLLQFDKSDALTETNLSDFVLAQYSAQHWTHHLSSITRQDVEIFDSIMELLNMKGAPFLTCIRLYNPDDINKGTNFRRILSTIPSPLYYASRAGLTEVARRLVSEINANVNTQGGKYGYALQAASYYGHLGVVQLLVERGANINTNDRGCNNGEFGNALQASLYHNHLDIVKFLVEKGAEIRAPGKFPTALHAASYYGNLDAIQFLVEKGANANAWDELLQIASTCGHLDVVRFLVDGGANINGRFVATFSTALQTVSWRGYLDIVKLLIEKGADINIQGGQSGNALQAASSHGHLDIVNILVEKGANVNAGGGNYCNPLQAALSNDYLDVARLLVEKGADVNVQLVRGGASTYALNMASYKGDTAFIELLVEKGADVNVKGGKFGYALQAASSEGHLEIVKFLVEKGANVNAQGGKFGNALQAASLKGDLSIVRLLLDAGADVNAKGGEFGHALQAASVKGNQDIVQLLVEKGAEVSMQDGQFGHALQAASSEAHIRIAQFLVENGADVNMQGGKYGNALQAASAKGDLATVHFLIEKGANVNAGGGDYCNALQAASSNGHLKVVQLLVQRGADINTPGGKYGHALQVASLEGHPDIVKFLLEKGANVNAFGGDYCNALQAASSNGHLNVARLLLEKGANVNAQCTNESGPYALYTSSMRGDLALVEFLVEHGADVNAQGGKFGQALQAASTMGYINIVKFLVEKGANVNAQGGKFGNALQAASAKEGADIVKFLVENGADVNAQGGKFGHALQAASAKGDLGIVEILVENGADVNAQDGKFGNALQAASDYEYYNRYDHEAVARLLIEKGAYQ